MTYMGKFGKNNFIKKKDGPSELEEVTRLYDVYFLSHFE